MKELSIVVEEAQLFATSIILDFPERFVYHDIKFAKRYVSFIDNVCDGVGLSDDERNLGKIGAWLISSSYGKSNTRIGKKNTPETNIEEVILEHAKIFFADHPIKQDYRLQLETAVQEIFFPKKPQTKMGMLLVDAMTADLVMGKGKKRLSKLYKEILLGDVNIGKSKWYDMIIGILSELHFYLPYCKENLQPKLNELILELEKDKKKLEKNSELALKKELDISDAELKQLKKNLSNSKGRDDRGIQTVFRTTSKNHYTLNQMVDQKASIMITVNAIILSLVLGGIIGEVNDHGHPHISLANVPIYILCLTSIFSIIFAILAIRPGNTHGEFTENEIRNKQGNLLYYGNFHNMQMRDYEWAFFQMMNDQDYLYSSMAKDIFFLGQLLKTKYKLIRISLTIFMVGMIISVAFFFMRFFL